MKSRIPSHYLHKANEIPRDVDQTQIRYCPCNGQDNTSRSDDMAKDLELRGQITWSVVSEWLRHWTINRKKS